MVSYPNHTIPGQASQTVNQYLVHILSPVTDNCSSWISGRGRMAVEMFSWPSLHKKNVPDVGIELATACMSSRHVLLSYSARPNKGQLKLLSPAE